MNRAVSPSGIAPPVANCVNAVVSESLSRIGEELGPVRVLAGVFAGH